jgi:hypothetical protein
LKFGEKKAVDVQSGESIQYQEPCHDGMMEVGVAVGNALATPLSLVLILIKPGPVAASATALRTANSLCDTTGNRIAQGVGDEKIEVR